MIFSRISIILTTFIVFGNAVQSKAQTMNSVLSQGDWAYVDVVSDAVYKLTTSDLASLGFSGSSWPTNQLGIWGWQAGMIPASNAILRSEDLLPLPIWVDDGGDGSLDAGDAIYFYGQSPHAWTYDEASGLFKSSHHYYSDHQRYFVTVTEGGQRIQQLASQPANAGIETRYVYTKHHELDQVNLVGSGLQWFGEIFDFNLQHSIDMGLSRLDAQSELQLLARGAGRSNVSGTQLKFETNQGEVGKLSFAAVNYSAQFDYVNAQVGLYTQQGAQSNWGDVVAEFDRSANPSATAWLDYVEVNADAPLQWLNAAQIIRFKPSDSLSDINQIQLQSATSGVRVWDVTQPMSARSLVTQFANQQLTWTLPRDSARSLVMFTPGGCPKPTLGTAVENQNIHQWGQVDYVMVAPDHLIAEAERLAQFHRGHGLTVKVVDVRKVYNEFSGGVQDISAIKDMMRMLWNRASTPEDRPEYLLLFGDCSYDFKDRLTPNENQVPSFQSYSSFTLYRSFFNDDFFGFMDSAEGTNLLLKDLDLCVGRIPVNTESEARGVVNKILAYADPAQSLGPWRKRVLMVADDADQVWEPLLTTVVELVAKKYDTLYPFLEIDKIYMDSYVQQSSAGSQSYPQARTELIQSIEDGNLVTTYSGHGGEVGWSSEQILQMKDVTSFRNGAKLPLFITLTCEFSRMDDPNRQSAGEALLLNPNGGAIALLSTTRVVYVSGVATLNDSISNNLFEKEGNQYRTFGQILRSAKNGTGSGDKLRFALLGDPALRLNVPEHNIFLDSINGKFLPQGVSTAGDTLEALSMVNISGHLEDGPTGQLMQSFDGELTLTLFDKVRKSQTLVNDGYGPSREFEQWKNAAYRGVVQVEDGIFHAEWFMPLDIALQLGKGRLSMYAENGQTDASGSDARIWVGGINDQAPIDTVGPSIELFMGDKRFESGGITGPDPIGLVVLSDPSGINAVGNGIGHDIRGALDSNWNESFNMNSRYQSDLNTFTSGTATWPFKDLEDGEHRFAARAWDSYNNVSQAEITFVVVSRENLELGGLRLFPSPGQAPIHVEFEHNNAGDSLNVVVGIYDIRGGLVYETTWSGVPHAPVVEPLIWDGRTQNGTPLPDGWYIVRVDATRLSDGQNSSSAERLILLN